MAQFKVLKDVTLKAEKRELVKDDEIELTVKRADEIEDAVEKQRPGYGPVFARIEEK